MPPTTKLDRLFLIINRTISLIILLALILAAAAAASMLLPSKPKQQPGEQRVEARAETSDDTVVLGFGHAEAIDGTDTEMIRLTANTGAAKYSSSAAGETRNVLFVGATDKPARWLFKDHSNAVVKLDQLRDTTGPREPTITRALYIEFRKQTSNDEPPLTVALARPDGSAFTPVLQDVTRVLSYRRIDASRVAILFQRGTTLMQADIALDSFTVLRQRQVEKVPNAL